MRLKSWIPIAVLVAALVWLWIDRSAALATQQERHAQEIAAERTQAAQEARIKADRAIAAAEEEVERLRASSRRKDEQIKAERQRANEIASESEAALEEVSSLELPFLVQETVVRLEIELPAIEIVPEGALWSEDAVRRNLGVLIQGQAAMEILPLKESEIVLLGGKVFNAERVAEEIGKELAAEREAFGSEREAFEAELESKSATVKAVKARARKSKFRWFVVGVVTGAAIVASR